MSDEIAVVGDAGRNDTLGDILRRAAYAQLPSRFYGLLQFCAPLSVQLWISGSPRIAGWMFAASAFGAWAVAQQHISGYAEAFPRVTLENARSRAWRFLRGASATLGGLTTLALLGDAFVRLMAIVFKCPGCAG